MAVATLANPLAVQPASLSPKPVGNAWGGSPISLTVSSLVVGLNVKSASAANPLPPLYWTPWAGVAASIVGPPGMPGRQPLALRNAGATPAGEGTSPFESAVNSGSIVAAWVGTRISTEPVPADSRPRNRGDWIGARSVGERPLAPVVALPHVPSPRSESATLPVPLGTSPGRVPENLPMYDVSDGTGTSSTLPVVVSRRPSTIGPVRVTSIAFVTELLGGSPVVPPAPTERTAPRPQRPVCPIESRPTIAP